jgi:hypothetical protein
VSTSTPAPWRSATAIAEEIGQDVDDRPVETDGAARVAGLIADLPSRSRPIP